MNFLLSILIFAQNPLIEAPKNVQSAEFRLGKIEINTTGQNVKWINDTKLDILSLNNGKTIVYTGKSGSYKLICYTAVDNLLSDPVTINITIGDNLPLPPDSIPEFQLLYNNDKSENVEKENNLKELIEIYKLLSIKANDVAYVKINELNALAKNKSKNLNASLVEIRKAISSDLKNYAVDKELTPELRKELSDKFKTIYVKLEEVK
jgi:hypothetical protein